MASRHVHPLAQKQTAFSAIPVGKSFAKDSGVVRPEMLCPSDDTQEALCCGSTPEITEIHVLILGISLQNAVFHGVYTPVLFPLFTTFGGGALYTCLTIA